MTQGIQAYYTRNGPYGSPTGQTGDANAWALAFYYAYRTYKQESLLNTAISIWNMTYAANFITPSDAASGTAAGRNITFAPLSDCHPGALSPRGTPSARILTVLAVAWTLAGGVFGVCITS